MFDRRRKEVLHTMVTRDPNTNPDDLTRTMPTTETGYTTPATTSTTGTATGTTTGIPTGAYAPRGDVTGYSGSSNAESSSTTDDMKERASEMTDAAREKAGQAMDQARDTMGAARERVSGAMSSATQTVEGQKDTVAGGLDSVAGTLRERAETIPGGERTTQMAQTAADRMESTATYLRDHEMRDMMTDVEDFVRTHPTESLVIALAAGFLVGRAVRG